MASGSKLWGGRFESGTDSTLEELNNSLYIDKRLFEEDIQGSQAYAKSLTEIFLLTQEECKEIIEGLNIVKTEWQNGTIEFKQGDEDVHTVNERRLKELIGIAATKLHVGRSRNDQIITDLKLWMKKHLKNLYHKIEELIRVIILRAVKEIDILMPGYTHLQRAQPVRWSHWLLSHAWGLKTSANRLISSLTNLETLPLGSGALAGNPFPINRLALAEELGFNEITQNSMHTVGDRDFVTEFLFFASILSLNLSKFSEDLILYSTKEFNFITISDEFSTGSSLMPQKRNPDSLELIRGSTGYIFGQFSGFMMTLKSLPSTYNKDLQYDKEALFNVYDKIDTILTVTIGVVQTMQVNPKNCYSALSYEMLATDLAYYLVRKGVAFRTAHHIAGQVVTEAEKKGILIHDLTLEELKNISDHFESDVSRIWNYEVSVEQYQAVGGTCKTNILNQISSLEQWLNSTGKI